MFLRAVLNFGRPTVNDIVNSMQSRIDSLSDIAAHMLDEAVEFEAKGREYAEHAQRLRLEAARADRIRAKYQTLTIS